MIKHIIQHCPHVVTHVLRRATLKPHAVTHISNFYWCPNLLSTIYRVFKTNNVAICCVMSQ